MPRLEGSVTRCDIRVPNEIYERIEALAIERGAKTHHRSHKPEVTGVILDLIKIGLANPHLSDNPSDSIADISDDRLEGIITKVSDRVTDTISDKLKALSELSDRVSDIEGIRDELMGKIAGLEMEVGRLSQAGGDGAIDDNGEESIKVIARKVGEILNYKAMAARLSYLSERVDRAYTIFRYSGITADEKDIEPITIECNTEPDPVPQKGISRATLSPIFDDYDGGGGKPLSNRAIAKIIGTTDTNIGRWLKGHPPRDEKTKEKHKELFDRYRHTPDGWIEK